ncbi:MAG: hypothetical protein ABMA64_23380 [Myxococcota bacterium]
MVSLLLVTTARAECPWTTIESVSADMVSITINGATYPAKGSTARAEFLSTLTRCGATPQTLDAFEDWRLMRRATNFTFGVGLVVWPLWIATPFTATAAGARRDDLVIALSGGDWCAT